MNFNPDGTTQPAINNLSIITGTYNDLITTNDLNTGLATKQNTLTNATNLLGIGSAISALDYTKITLNKPATFPADMTNIYTKTETNNLLGTKQDTLTNTTNLLGIGSAITALDYNKITINKPATFPADMTNIYTKSEILALSTLTNYYTKTSTDTLLNAKQANLTFTAPLTNTANTVSINLSSYQPLLTNATNLLGIGSAITALDYTKITLNKPTNFQADWNSTVTNKPDLTVYNAWTKNVNDIYTTITAGNVAIGSSSTATYKLNVAGSLNATSIYNNGTLINFSSYLTSANLSSTYLALAGGTMTGALTLTTTSGNNQLVISSTASGGNNCIQITNNLNNSVYIGYGGSTFGGNYQSSLFLEASYGGASIVFNTGGTISSNVPRMIINSSGNVGIGVLPTYKFDVNGDARVYNGTGQTNFYIGSGASSAVLNLWDIATAAWKIETGGYNLTISNGTIGGSTTARLTILQNGTINTAGNIDCGGGIAISGSTTPYNPSSIAENASLINTYIAFKGSTVGAGNDWAYLRQIGGNESIKLALDFHDDANDARFCIRGIASAGNNPDIITEVFTVDNGNVNITGGLTTGAGANSFLGGLRINGSDTGNTIYQNSTTANIGFTLRDANTFNFWSFSSAGAYTNIANMNTSVIVFNKPVNILNNNGSFTHFNFSGGNQNYLRGDTNIDLNVLKFGERTQNYLIYLYGNDYGFGINGGTLRYNSANYHTFYSGGTENVKFNQYGFGYHNTTPLDDNAGTNFLCIGSSGTQGKNGAIIIGKNSGGGSQRQFRISYDVNYNMTFGDFGGNNNASQTWKTQFGISYSAPDSSLFLAPSGNVFSVGTYNTYSDEKIKTDIKTIDNALWKVQQLRGVYYTQIFEGTKNIGLIAQEVEHIIPEVVSYNDTSDLKSVNYASIVGLLINAIKEQQEIIDNQNNKINNILDILSRNNLI